MQHNHLVSAVLEELEGPQREIALEQQVGDKDDQTASPQQVDHPAQRRLRRGALTRHHANQLRQQLMPLRTAGTGRKDTAHRIVERDQPSRVPLSQEDQPDGCRQPLGVGQLRQGAGRVASPRHGATGVEHKHRPQVGLCLI